MNLADERRRFEKRGVCSAPAVPDLPIRCAMICQDQGKYAQVEPSVHRGPRGARRLLGEEHSQTLIGIQGSCTCINEGDATVSKGFLLSAQAPFGAIITRMQWMWT